MGARTWINIHNAYKTINPLFSQIGINFGDEMNRQKNRRVTPKMYNAFFYACGYAYTGVGPRCNNIIVIYIYIQLERYYYHTRAEISSAHLRITAFVWVRLGYVV